MKLIFTVITVLFFLTACENKDKSVEILIEMNYNVQQLNYMKYFQGTEFFEEFTDVKNDRNNDFKNIPLITAREYIYSKLKKIDTYAGKSIREIDKVKILILKHSGENTNAKDDEYHIYRNSIDYQEDSSSEPLHLNFKNIKNKNQKLDFSLFINSQNEPTKLSLNLWNLLHDTRIQLIRTLTTYKWFDQSASFGNFDFNSSLPQNVFVYKFRLYVENNKSIYSEDKYSVLEIFRVLTLDKNFSNCENWIRSNFQGLTVLEALGKLGSIQSKIMDARYSAIICWGTKISHCGSIFDMNLPYTNGPTTINLGDTLHLKLTIAAFDSSKDPIVSVNDKNALIQYKDGIGYVKVKPNRKGLITYSGEMIKSFGYGRSIKQPWTWTVTVN